MLTFIPFGVIMSTPIEFLVVIGMIGTLRVCLRYDTPPPLSTLSPTLGLGSTIKLLWTFGGNG